MYQEEIKLLKFRLVDKERDISNLSRQVREVNIDIHRLQSNEASLR